MFEGVGVEGALERNATYFIRRAGRAQLCFGRVCWDRRWHVESAVAGKPRQHWPSSPSELRRPSLRRM